MKKVKIESPRKLRKVLNTYITELDIPWRILDALKDSGCIIIGDVVQKNEKELITDGLLDKKSVNELKIALEELNLRLGMEVNEHLELSNREKTVREALGRGIDELHLSDKTKQQLKKWGLTTASWNGKRIENPKGVIISLQEYPLRFIGKGEKYILLGLTLGETNWSTGFEDIAKVIDSTIVLEK